MSSPVLDGKPELRKKVYGLFWLASLSLGAIGAGFGAAGDLPNWYAPAAAVYAFLAAGVGYTASSNTKADE